MRQWQLTSSSSNGPLRRRTRTERKTRAPTFAHQFAFVRRPSERAQLFAALAVANTILKDTPSDVGSRARPVLPRVEVEVHWAKLEDIQTKCQLVPTLHSEYKRRPNEAQQMRRPETRVDVAKFTRRRLLIAQSLCSQKTAAAARTLKENCARQEE